MVKNGDRIFVLGKLCFDFCLIKVFNFNLLSFCFKIIEFIYFGHFKKISSLKEGLKLKQLIRRPINKILPIKGRVQWYLG
jgi:hypothetical protein